MTLIRHNELGATGAVVSELCLSTLNFGWTIRPEAAWAFLDRFHADGGNFLLAAGLCPGVTRPLWTEAPEVCVGRWWRSRELRREELVLATKLVLSSRGRASGEEIEACLDASLRRLQTDHVDLVVFDPPDPAPAMAEWIETMARLVRKGKVSHVAAGSVLAWHLAALATRATGLPAWQALSADYSLLDRSAERLLAGLTPPLPGFVAQSPLAGGILAGREARRPHPEVRRRRETPAGRSDGEAEKIRSALAAVAAECESTLAQVAIAWALSNPAVSSVVLSALSLNQLTDAIGACTVDLAWTQLRRLDLASSLLANAPAALVG
jgi:aryl-alcohol dehydrogenase-like predicted oxidoreductase